MTLVQNPRWRTCQGKAVGTRHAIQVWRQRGSLGELCPVRAEAGGTLHLGSSEVPFWGDSRASSEPHHLPASVRGTEAAVPALSPAQPQICSLTARLSLPTDSWPVVHKKLEFQEFLLWCSGLRI